MDWTSFKQVNLLLFSQKQILVLCLHTFNATVSAQLCSPGGPVPVWRGTDWVLGLGSPSSRRQMLREHLDRTPSGRGHRTLLSTKISPGWVICWGGYSWDLNSSRKSASPVKPQKGCSLSLQSVLQSVSSTRLNLWPVVPKHGICEYHLGT